MLFKRPSSLALVPDVATLPANTPLMSTRSVEKSFPVGPGQTYVLRRITLDIKPGEFVSIMGPSGAGKSTLLHILGMHDVAWSGEYFFMGQPIHSLAPKQRGATKKDLYPSQLSGGQQQLVGVARAVVANPSVILADEPTGNLHSSQGQEIMGLFKTLNEQGTTIVQVTHSETNAAYGSRVIKLRDGFMES
jgi:putative ABC transport system ATP-binding protein